VRRSTSASVLAALADPEGRVALPPPPPPPLADALHPLASPGGSLSLGDDDDDDGRGGGGGAAASPASRSPRSPPDSKASSPASARSSPYAPSPRGKPRRRADRTDPVALFAERQRDWEKQRVAAARRRAGRPLQRRASPNGPAK